MPTEAQAKKLVADLIGMAHGQAENVLVRLSAEHKQLVPTFLVMTGSRVEIFACPWQSDEQKYMAQDLIRARMKAQGSQAYSFLSEAWMLVVDKDEHDENERKGVTHLQPSQSERRIEVVTAVACAKHDAGMARDFGMWNIVRNDQGDISALETHIFPDGAPIDVGGEFPTLLDD